MDMKLLKEFKEFAVKGNMMEMAIGIIIGAAFNNVINVLAKEVILPPLSLLSKGDVLEQKRLVLRNGITDASGTITTAEVSIAYGKLFEVFLDFIIIGITVFIVVKFMNRLKQRAHNPKDTTIATPTEIELLTKLNTLIEEQNTILKSEKAD